MMSDEEGDESNAMQQMMGFSSFGTSQRPKKEPQESTSGAFSASGANSAPLTKRAKISSLSPTPTHGSTMSKSLADTTSKIRPLSSSPPSFWPASVPPQPKSAASFGTMSSTQSYSTAREHQSIPGASSNTQGSCNDLPSGRSLLPHSMQDARYTSEPSTLPSPSIQDARYAPLGALAPSSSQDARYPPPPGITVPSQSPPPESSFGQPPGPPGYTHPKSGISLTRQELSELRSGKKNEKGDLVYFQPSFVDPNPWSGLKKASRGAVY